jgi:hypothetical protein
MHRRDQRLQTCDRQGFVAVLRALVASDDGRARRPVRRPDGAFRAVLVLPAGTSGPQGFKKQVRFVQFGLLGRFGQAAHGNEPVLSPVAGPEAAPGNPLHAAFPRPGKGCGSLAVDGHEDGWAARFHFGAEGQVVVGRFLPHDLDDSGHGVAALGGPAACRHAEQDGAHVRFLPGSRDARPAVLKVMSGRMTATMRASPCASRSATTRRMSL